MPAAVAIPAAVSAGSSILGGLLGSSASKKASQQQQAALQQAQQQVGTAVTGAQKTEDAGLEGANQSIETGTGGANQTLADVYQQQQGALNPYLTAGNQGVTTLASMLAPGGDLTKQFSFSGEDLANTPGYQFQQQQGQSALQRSAAAKGGALGGSTLGSLLKYSQGLADSTYGQAYQRAQDTFQMNRNNTMQGLMALTGIGQGATSQYLNAAQNYGNTSAGNLMQSGFAQGNNMLRSAEYKGNAGLQGAQSIAQLLGQQGNAQAAGTVGSANAWSSALGGVGNAAQSYGIMNTLGNIYGPQGTGTAPGTYTNSFPTYRAPFDPYSNPAPSYSTPSSLGSFMNNLPGATPSYGTGGGV